MAAPTFVETTMQILHRGFLCLPCMRGRRAVRRAFKHWANHWYHESDSTEDDERTASAFRIGHRAGTAVLPPCSTPQQLTEHQNKNTRRGTAGAFIMVGHCAQHPNAPPVDASSISCIFTITFPFSV